MRNRGSPGIVLALALLCGAAAAVLSVRYIRADAAPAIALPVVERSQQLAVAARDLPQGSLLTAEDVRLVSWPDDALPEGYFGSADEVVGRGLTTPLRRNEPVIAGKVAGEGEGGGLPVLIPDGMRALSVNVSQVSAVAGFVAPGSRVDVLLTVDGSGEPLTRTFLQNMTVLAVNQSIVEDQEGKPMSVGIVTFLVTPEQAERLTLATQEGRLQLVLRNRADVEEVTTAGARRPDLGPPTRPAAQPTRSSAATSTQPPRTREAAIEIFKGGARTLVTFSPVDR